MSSGLLNTSANQTMSKFMG